jgi:hypothetical protein
MFKALIATLAVAGSAVAQTAPPTPQGSPTERAAGAAQRGQDVVKMTKLPQKAQEVRDKGVPAPEMKEALEAARAKGVKAHEMADLTDEQSKAIDQHGRIENFGSFVKSKLNEGLRGRELAAAIREEHAKRGIGHQGKGKGQDKDKAGKPKDREQNDGKADKPANDHDEKEKGNSEKGKPSSPGKGKGRP